MPTKSQEIMLAQYAHITKWKPMIGDYIAYYGWFNNWFGVINKVDANHVSVITEGTPALLLTLNETQYPKNTKYIPINKIFYAKFGTYNIIQNNCWYING